MKKMERCGRPDAGFFLKCFRLTSLGYPFFEYIMVNRVTCAVLWQRRANLARKGDYFPLLGLYEHLNTVNNNYKNVDNFGI